MNVTIESVLKFQQRLMDAPASITIITSDDIKKSGYRTLADALHSVGGQDLSQSELGKGTMVFHDAVLRADLEDGLSREDAQVLSRKEFRRNGQKEGDAL